MCNAMEKTSKANKKKVSLGEPTTMHLHLAPQVIFVSQAHSSFMYKPFFLNF
jgi:hypothetical protein